jgi:predicted cation transporter
MIGLLVILILVLILPFTVKAVERNLEIFILIMGVSASLVSGMFEPALLAKALKDPVYISIAVLAAGVLFKWIQTPLKNGISRIGTVIPYQLFLAIVVIILGLISSVITAIIASLVLVAIVSVVRLDRQSEIRFVILACFSIGLGAALTPLGEPLSTIAISKLNQDFDYLLRVIGLDVLTAIIILGWLTIMLVHPHHHEHRDSGQTTETYSQIIGRAIKVYLFVAGLTCFGQGFQPFIDQNLIGLKPMILYWINIVSAVLDNATLTAAEISPSMNELSIRSILLGLLISGGMLVPGNIPNIIAAGKLNISSKEWARFGLPIGLMLLILYFLIIFFLS